MIHAIEKSIYAADCFSSAGDYVREADLHFQSEASNALVVAFNLYLESDGSGYRGLVPRENAYTPFWQAALDVTLSPVLQARLADLLWCRRSGRSFGLAAKTALVGYTCLVNLWRGMSAAGCAQRAWRLARSTNNMPAILETLSNVERELLEVIGDSMQPGAAMTYFDLLVQAPRKLLPANQVIPLLERGKQTFRSSRYVFEEIVRLQMRLNVDVPGAQRAHQVEIAENWERAAATDSDPLRAFFTRQTAIDRAHSLPEVRDRLMQSQIAVSLAQLGLVKHRVEFSADERVFSEAVKNEVDRYLGALTYSDALKAIVSGTPPSGNRQQNMEEAQSRVNGQVLLSLTTLYVVDPHSGLARPVEELGQHVLAELGRAESDRVMHKTQFVLADVLRQLAQRYGMCEQGLVDCVAVRAEDREAGMIVGTAYFH